LFRKIRTAFKNEKFRLDRVKEMITKLSEKCSGSASKSCVLGLLDPDPLVRDMDPDPDPDPDPSIIKKNSKKS
jgi:hypothetical protein